MRFKFDELSTNPDCPAYIIAEIGVNHNGSLDLALEMVRSAADCGADAVKFQTFTARGLVSPNTPKVEYQKTTTSPEESHYQMIKSLEMPRSFYSPLLNLCQELGVDFLSTPYDVESVDYLESIDVGLYKVASADIVDHILLEKIARTGKPTILSTGMATLGEIEEAVGIFRKLGNEQVILLHCVSNYPCSHSSLNLRAMRTLHQAFSLPVGYSDHSVGPLAATLSIALGAVLIEKHFTTDKSLPGPDQAASSSPQEFKELVDQVRLAEASLGTSLKSCQDEERQMSQVSRKSIVARRGMKAGEVIRWEDLTMKRPGTGIRGRYIAQLEGKTLRRDVEADQLLSWGDLE